jgi:hypothetical protein
LLTVVTLWAELNLCRWEGLMSLESVESMSFMLAESLNIRLRDFRYLNGGIRNSSPCKDGLNKLRCKSLNFLMWSSSSTHPLFPIHNYS